MNRAGRPPRFCYVFPCELQGPAWAVGRYSSSQSAGETSQNIICKTLRQIGRPALYFWWNFSLSNALFTTTHLKTVLVKRLTYPYRLLQWQTKVESMRLTNHARDDRFVTRPTLFCCLFDRVDEFVALRRVGTGSLLLHYFKLQAPLSSFSSAACRSPFLFVHIHTASVET